MSPASKHYTGFCTLHRSTLFEVTYHHATVSQLAELNQTMTLGPIVASACIQDRTNTTNLVCLELLQQLYDTV